MRRVCHQKPGALEALLIELHHRDCQECFQGPTICFSNIIDSDSILKIWVVRLDHPYKNIWRMMTGLMLTDSGLAVSTRRMLTDDELHCRMCRKCGRMVTRKQRHWEFEMFA